MSSSGQNALSNYVLIPRCLAVVLNCAKTPSKKAEESRRTEREIFKDFVNKNRTCYWNPHLKESIENLQFAGYLVDSSCLLASGRDIYLNTVQNAWSRKVLRPPSGFSIHTVGKISDLGVQMVPQAPFTPLPEVLCLVIADCNQARVCATLDVILAQLQEHYGQMQQPDEEVVYGMLESLMKDRKIYHSGSGYFILTPETYQVNGCITVVDDHIIIGSTGSHGNKLPAIYIPLLAAAASGKAAAEKKTSSSQMQTIEIDDATAIKTGSQLETPKGSLFQNKSQEVESESGSQKGQGCIQVHRDVKSREPRHSKKISSCANASETKHGSRKWFTRGLLLRKKKSKSTDAPEMPEKREDAAFNYLEAAACSRSTGQKSETPQSPGKKSEPIYEATPAASKADRTLDTYAVFDQSCVVSNTKKKKVPTATLR